MRLLIDMNLSPAWVDVLASLGFSAVHWSSIGDPRADDSLLMEWARVNDCVVLTHDLDFGAILAVTNAAKPSVIQLRTLNVLPERLATLVSSVLRQHEAELLAGALVVLDEAKCRVRVLPLA